MSTQGTSAQSGSVSTPSGEILRSIAHELRQPLSTIESIAYYLSLVLPHEEEKLQEQLAQIQRLVEQSNWILTSGLQLNDPAVTPTAEDPTWIDLEELVLSTTASQPTRAGFLVRLELAGDLPLVRLDPGVARALVENVLMLFRQFATESLPVIVRTFPSTRRSVALEVTAAVPGYRSESMLGAGSALSLRSARAILEAQGGLIDLSVDEADGVRICLHLQ